jgi:hypothetical protein
MMSLNIYTISVPFDDICIPRPDITNSMGWEVEGKKMILVWGFRDDRT